MGKPEAPYASTTLPKHPARDPGLQCQRAQGGIYAAGSSWHSSRNKSLREMGTIVHTAFLYPCLNAVFSRYPPDTSHNHSCQISERELLIARRRSSPFQTPPHQAIPAAGLGVRSECVRSCPRSAGWRGCRYPRRGCGHADVADPGGGSGMTGGTGVRVYLACEVTVMRKGIDALPNGSCGAGAPAEYRSAR